MEFDDYEKKVRDSFPMLIDSYVEQYGEEYRQYIAETLNNLNIYFYVTPQSIYNYVSLKTWDDKIKGILAGFNELGIDTSNVKVHDDFTLRDEENMALQTMISTFFPNLKDWENNKKIGLNLFDSKYDQDKRSIKKRLRFLEKLGEKESNIDDDEYIRSNEYLDLVEKYQKVLNIFNRHIKNHTSNMRPLLEKAKEIEEYSSLVEDLLIKEFMVDMYQYLPEEDKKVIAKNEKYQASSLKSYRFYFDDDDYGLLEYFYSDFDEMLVDRHVSENQKRKIINRRLTYLKLKGFDIKKLKNVNLYCDWDRIDMIRDYLPDFDHLEKITIKKEELFDKKNQMVIPKLIINNKKIGTYEINFLAESADSAVGSFCCNPGDFSKNVFFDIFNDAYNLYDIIIDHELRHAIEFSFKTKNGGYHLKSGNGFDVVDNNGNYVRSDYANFNEVVTQKLSVEATTKRWLENKFIFSDRYALHLAYPSSSYDVDIPKVSIIFDEFRDEIMKTRIEDDSTAIYKIIPKRTLSKIDYLIGCNNGSEIIKLYNIRDELKKGQKRKIKRK